MSRTWHLILLVAIAAVICGLALAWVERNARFVETDGIDGLSTYHILLDTADGLSAEKIKREVYPTRERMPAAERATAVCSPAGQTVAEDTGTLP